MMKKSKVRVIERISRQVTADRLGVCLNHIDKLIEFNKLDAIDVALPDSKRPSIRITIKSIKEYEDACKIKRAE